MHASRLLHANSSQALKKYNASRKLKKAAMGLLAQQRMARLLEAGRAQQ